MQTINNDFTTTVIKPLLPRWWTTEDVAAYRGISVRTVYNMVRRAKEMKARGEEGGIPFSQPKGTKHLRFKPEAIMRFFEGEEI